MITEPHGFGLSRYSTGRGWLGGHGLARSATCLVVGLILLSVLPAGHAAEMDWRPLPGAGQARGEGGRLLLGLSGEAETARLRSTQIFVASNAEEGGDTGTRRRTEHITGSGSVRERLLLDFGWTFDLGHACDPKQDFDFEGHFRKSDSFSPVSTTFFNDDNWRSVNLPHDWAIELPFQGDSTPSKGFHPLGRTFPATSIGWYRRIFELPASDTGKRITLEFDGVHREAMVILPLPGFPCDLSLAGIEVEAAEMEENVDLEAFAVTIAEGLLDQAGNPIVQPL